MSVSAIPDAIIAGSNAWIFTCAGLEAYVEPAFISDIKSLPHAPATIARSLWFLTFLTSFTVSTKYLLFL